MMYNGWGIRNKDLVIRGGGLGKRLIWDGVWEVWLLGGGRSGMRLTGNSALAVWDWGWCVRGLVIRGGGLDMILIGDGG
jgi:hypothetical protein